MPEGGLNAHLPPSTAPPVAANGQDAEAADRLAVKLYTRHGFRSQVGDDVSLKCIACPLGQQTTLQNHVVEVSVSC